MSDVPRDLQQIVRKPKGNDCTTDKIEEKAFPERKKLLKIHLLLPFISFSKPQLTRNKLRRQLKANSVKQSAFSTT